MLALEVITLPVADVDRARAFYAERVGFSVDVDYHPSPTFRVVQLTPPGSACSVHLLATDSIEPLKNLLLVTDDLVAERAELVRRSVRVSECRHKDPVDAWEGGWKPGMDPQRRDYASFADFVDPDGNSWTLQERGYRPA